MSTQRGMAAEDLVARELEKNQFTIVTRNYSSRWGEIDLIAKQKNLLVFVEVKMRTKNYFDACELITSAKQAKIITTAKQFISSHKYLDTSYRFDVALVDGSFEQHRITYIPDAFQEK